MAVIYLPENPYSKITQQIGYLLGETLTNYFLNKPLLDKKLDTNLTDQLDKVKKLQKFLPEGAITDNGINWEIVNQEAQKGNEAAQHLLDVRKYREEVANSNFIRKLQIMKDPQALSTLDVSLNPEILEQRQKVAEVLNKVKDTNPLLKQLIDIYGVNKLAKVIKPENLISFMYLQNQSTNQNTNQVNKQNENITTQNSEADYIKEIIDANTKQNTVQNPTTLKKNSALSLIPKSIKKKNTQKLNSSQGLNLPDLSMLLNLNQNNEKPLQQNNNSSNQNNANLTLPPQVMQDYNALLNYMNNYLIPQKTTIK